MIRIALCDDQKMMLDIFREKLERYREERNLQLEFSYFLSAAAYIENWTKESEVDILLLDIQMDDMNGIELKNYLEAHNSRTKIIFLTNYDSLMSKAFGLNVCGFLQKTISDENLFAYLDKLCRLIQEDKVIEIYGLGGKNVVKSSEIVLLKAEGRYSRIKLCEEEVFSDKSLNEWEQELTLLHFFRVHKSYIVNYMYVSRLGEKIKLSNNEYIPIARRRRKQAEKEYMKFLRSRI